MVTLTIRVGLPLVPVPLPLGHGRGERDGRGRRGGRGGRGRGARRVALRGGAGRAHHLAARVRHLLPGWERSSTETPTRGQTFNYQNINVQS